MTVISAICLRAVLLWGKKGEKRREDEIRGLL